MGWSWKLSLCQFAFITPEGNIQDPGGERAICSLTQLCALGATEITARKNALTFDIVIPLLWV